MMTRVCVSATIEHSRQRAGSDDPFFILRDVNMERRPLLMCGERTFQFQPHFVAPLYTPHRQPLAVMPILENQLANTAVVHQTLRFLTGAQASFQAIRFDESHHKPVTGGNSRVGRIGARVNEAMK
jgi:hypothetical protein